MTPEQHEQLLNSPALSPPDGVRREWVDPPNMENLERVIAQLIVTTLVVGMRLYTKARVMRKMWLEDYMLLVAWVIFLGAFHPVAFLAEKLPLGVHQWNMTVRHLIKHAYYYHIASLLYSFVMIPLKASLILQILRIFVPGYDRRMPLFLAVHCFLWFNILFYVTLIIYQIFACKPIAKAYDVTIEGGHCTNRMLVHIISAAGNTASDVLLFLLPQPAIWRLQLEWRRKVGLSALFLVGVFACIASSLRLRYAIVLYYSTDMTYQAALMGIWAEPELMCGFLAASLPVLPSFVRHVRSRPLIVKVLGSFGSKGSERAAPTQGRSSRSETKITKKGVLVTDVEFDELVGRPEAGSWRGSVAEREGEVEDGRSRSSIGGWSPECSKSLGDGSRQRSCSEGG